MIPSMVGPDQGWYFVRKIVVGLSSCAVYDVEDGWEPQKGWVTGDDGKFSYTKPSTVEMSGVFMKKREI